MNEATNVEFLKGLHYFLLFQDDRTSFRKVYFMSLEILKTVATETEKNDNVLKTDYERSKAYKASRFNWQIYISLYSRIELSG